MPGIDRSPASLRSVLLNSRLFYWGGNGGPGELMGPVLTALHTICPRELLTPRGPPSSPAPEVGAAWVSLCFMVEGALECEGQAEGPLPRPISPEGVRSLEPPSPESEVALLGLLRMEGMEGSEAGTLPHRTSAA